MNVTQSLHWEAFVSVDRVNRLCLSMSHDPCLRAVLQDSGVTAAQWESLVAAVRGGGEADVLTSLLDALEEAGAAAGLDGLTTGDRSFQELPGAVPGFRTVRGWRCPHARPCGRVQFPGESAAPTCPLTTDPLTPVKLVSG